MSIRHVTFDGQATIFEVTTLVDIRGNLTTDLSEAVTCVVEHDDKVMPYVIAELPFPIYTVH